MIQILSGHSLRYLHFGRDGRITCQFVCECGTVGAPLRNMDAASRDFDDHLRDAR